MPAFAAFGRVLFSILFIVSGAYKLSDIAIMADMVSTHISIPLQFSNATAQVETATGLPAAQLIVIASGIFEILCGLLIAANFGARVFSILLALFVAATVFYFHDFWNMTGNERLTNLFQALKNLSLIGGLMMIAGYPRRTIVSEATYDGV